LIKVDLENGLEFWGFHLVTVHAIHRMRGAALRSGTANLKRPLIEVSGAQPFGSLRIDSVVYLA